MHSALGGSRCSAFLVTARLSESDGPKTNGEVALARSRATTGALCSPALGEPDAYLVVSGGGGGTEIRKAPNDTAALGFVANSEAARYVFVVVAAADDAMITSRRYGTFVLAWRWSVQVAGSDRALALGVEMESSKASHGGRATALWRTLTPILV